MRKLLHFVHQSIDGYIEGPNGEFDWPLMGPELDMESCKLVATGDTFVYGRVVWEMMSSYWPIAESISDDPHDLAHAPIWRNTPKVVFSKTLEKADWNTRVLGGDLVEEVNALKAEPGSNLILFGGSHLAAALTEHNLIDEYHIYIHPVVLGGGKPVFANPQHRLNLKLAESRVFDSQVILTKYEI